MSNNPLRELEDADLLTRYEKLIWQAIDAAERSRSESRQMAWMRTVSSMMRTLADFRVKRIVFGTDVSGNLAKRVLDYWVEELSKDQGGTRIAEIE